jgi:SNF2 family DNA or RNA helicase
MLIFPERRLPERKPDAFPVQESAPSISHNHDKRSPSPASIPVESIDLSIRVNDYVTGWNRSLQRGPKITTTSIPVTAPRPQVVSVPIGRIPIKTKSFYFAEPPEWMNIFKEATEEEGTDAESSEKNPFGAESEENSDQNTDSTRCPASSLLKAGRFTRIKRPKDVVKLEDRLRYVLQPSLECLLAERSMEFPFQPFPYQLDGIAYLYSSHAAILADEMGLGKTMQAISTIRLLLRAREIDNVLLVCPKPLVTNWIREFELWAPELPIQVIEGDQTKRKWMWRLPDAPIRIANYELLNRDREFYEHDGTHQDFVHFDLVVLDESQRIKNQTSATAKAARAIPRSRNWALTGTPVENSSDDIVGIFEFISPGYLSPQIKPHRMAPMIADYVLRRTKDKVMTDLPPKMMRDAELNLTPEQQETYDMAETDGVLRLTEMGEGATIQHVFELVLRLKQICNFDPVTGQSAKLERLVADMEEVAQSGRKAIIFSQWVSALDRLKERLGEYNPAEYHGRIPSKQRDGQIERFRDDPDCNIILMSYGAGSVGLNLQFAEYVFLFDRWWNPAVEDQAINRAHRIGAAGPVTVTRFLSLGTIEERIDRVLQEKRELFETILSGTERHRSMGLDQKEIFGLFSLSSPQGPLFGKAS